MADLELVGGSLIHDAFFELAVAHELIEFHVHLQVDGSGKAVDAGTAQVVEDDGGLAVGGAREGKRQVAFFPVIAAGGLAGGECVQQVVEDTGWRQVDGSCFNVFYVAVIHVGSQMWLHIETYGVHSLIVFKL